MIGKANIYRQKVGLHVLTLGVFCLFEVIVVVHDHSVILRRDVLPETHKADLFASKAATCGFGEGYNIYGVLVEPSIVQVEGCRVRVLGIEEHLVLLSPALRTEEEEITALLRASGLVPVVHPIVGGYHVASCELESVRLKYYGQAGLVCLDLVRRALTVRLHVLDETIGHCGRVLLERSRVLVHEIQRVDDRCAEDI